MFGALHPQPAPTAAASITAAAASRISPYLFQSVQSAAARATAASQSLFSFAFHLHTYRINTYIYTYTCEHVYISSLCLGQFLLHFQCETHAVQIEATFTTQSTLNRGSSQQQQQQESSPPTQQEQDYARIWNRRWTCYPLRQPWCRTMRVVSTALSWHTWLLHLVISLIGAISACLSACLTTGHARPGSPIKQFRLNGYDDDML